MKEKYMKKALEQAELAFSEGEVPVGAVIVKDGKIISCARNNRERTADATGHAEIIAIREACQALGGWHLDGCELFVTLEPCPMCMGAIINSRLSRVTFGAKDAKAGACGSVIDLCAYPLNHKPTVENGILSDECSSLLSSFFIKRRDQRK